MSDSHKNFASSSVATAPSPTTSGLTLIVASGDGTKFQSTPFIAFNATVFPSGVIPTSANAEIVRVTAISTDTLTIVRAQEGTTAKAIQSGWQISMTITAKVITDAEGGRGASVSVGPIGSGADYICTGTNDGAQILAAYTSLGNNPGKVLIRNSSTAYDFSAISDRIFVSKSNITLEGESLGGVILKANASLFQGGSDALGQFGILTIGKNHSTMISNITLRNIIIDCNNQLKTAGLCVDGGSAIGAAIGIQNLTLENVLVKNSGQNISDPVTAGVFFASGINNALGGTHGYIDTLTVRNCDFGFGQRRAVYFQGTNITNVYFDTVKIHDNNADGIYIVDYGSITSSSDWTFKHIRFERNMAVTQSFSQAHMRDSTQVGVNNLTYDDIYFGPTLNPSTSQDYCLTPYWANNLKMNNMLLDQCGSGISIGASISGAYNRRFPINKALLQNVTFYKVRSCFDADSAQFMDFKDCVVWKPQVNPAFAPYSEHWLTTIDRVMFYDCHANDPSGSTSNNRAILRLNGDGFLVRRCQFIDDRKLTTPAQSLTLGQTSGGSMGARTYYVRFTYTSDSGETDGNVEQSIAISANNVLTINAGSASQNAPLGATAIKYYVSSTSGTEQLQTTINLPTTSFTWTEPTTGLVTGVSIPLTNSTITLTAYGIYEISGGGGTMLPNHYEDCGFYGIPAGQEIVCNSQYTRITRNNTTNPTMTEGGESLLERVPLVLGSASGSVQFNSSAFYQEVITATLTGPTTSVLTAGQYQGQRMVRRLTMGANGVTYTKASNELLAGGGYTPSATSGQTDIITQEWDTTLNAWVEITARLLNVS